MGRAEHFGKKMRVCVWMLGAALILSPAIAWAAKPKKCLTKVEIRAEQEVRHGVFLRESARRCDKMIPGLRAIWDKFAEDAAPHFRRAMDKRTKAYQREYPESWQLTLTHSDDRLVTRHRHLPLTRAFCENVQGLLKEVEQKGYGRFGQQAATIQNEVRADYRVCR